jgi:hypothetical protein
MREEPPRQTRMRTGSLSVTNLTDATQSIRVAAGDGEVSMR